MICVYILLSQNVLIAQSINYRHFTSNNGLPSNEVFGLGFDQSNYLWITTDKGICKYDGKTFTTYTSLDGISDNVYLNITQDVKK